MQKLWEIKGENMGNMFVTGICQNCHFKRVIVTLRDDKFVDNKGFQVMQHLTKHPDHTVKLVSYKGYSLYKLQNDKLVKIPEGE